MKVATVGTDASCDWRVVDEYASRVHCRIFQREDGSLWIEDAGSINGTFVNEGRVYGPTRIRPGDKIRVGRTVVEVPR